MEEKGLIIRKKNPEDGRGVLIYLTEFGKEKRELSKNTVLKFNDAVKQSIPEEKLMHFIEVADIINELILDKNIFNRTSVSELTDQSEKIENEISKIVSNS
jgi:DNA-binding MarR family transcriptional regulator